MAGGYDLPRNDTLAHVAFGAHVFQSNLVVQNHPKLTPPSRRQAMQFYMSV